ncbi:hypothetical protein B9T11_07795 [Wohlfahrtiimonas chitiniclastica]|uniref:hypothetical protein n=1 Tax=Wohlfahrtiimonas chitiniclastica TaxID=400946 RepID=UPI000B98EE48|nr:hypothetical protein [Wohlfahrtiimonas chitiniclastica]OYQ79130.1 hypothetical protein B9T11_07795 [Wohlfahrtiimonas chitiniclastica]
MFFTKFVIIDLKKQKANSFSFTNGVNIITATINKGGKSSVLKSLYYTLGIDQKNFKPEWNYRDMIFLLHYQHDQGKGVIARKDSNFYIGRDVSSLEVKNNKEYSTWFLELMNMKIKVPFKNSKERQSIYASTLWALFYVDQDTSWSDGIYKKTINRYMYGKDIFPKEILEYLLGLKSILNLDKKEQLESEKKRYASNNVRISTLSELQSAFITNHVSSIDYNEEIIKKNITSYLKLAAQLNSKIADFQSHLYANQVKLDSLNLEKRELIDIVKQSNILYKEYGSGMCKSCKTLLSDKHINDRIALDSNVIAIKEMIIGLERSIDELEKKIENYKIQQIFTQKEYAKITVLLKENKEKLSIHSYIQENANIQLNEKYFNILENLKNISKKSELVMERLGQEIKTNEGKVAEHSAKVKSDFSSYLSTFSQQYSISLVANDKRFLEFSEMKNSGSSFIELYVLYYMVYAKLLISHSIINLPFGFDTVVKDDLTDESIKNIYRLIESVLFTSNRQIFFVALENRIPYFKDQDILNIIKVDQNREEETDEWILSAAIYNKKNIQEIIKGIDIALG